MKKIRNQNALINQITNRNSNSFSSKNLKIKTRAEEEDRDYHRRGEGGTREFFDLLEKKLYVERWETVCPIHISCCNFSSGIVSSNFFLQISINSSQIIKIW